MRSPRLPLARTWLDFGQAIVAIERTPYRGSHPGEEGPGRQPEEEGQGRRSPAGGGRLHRQRTRRSPRLRPPEVDDPAETLADI